MHKDSDWPQLRRFQERQRLQEEKDEALKYAGTPDKPFVDQLTPEEEAARDRVLKARADGAARWEDTLRRAAELGLAVDDNGDVIETGPRGGKYRINSNGRKSYDVP